MINEWLIGKDWKGSGHARIEVLSQHSPGQNVKKKLSHDNRYLGQYSNRGLPNNESRALYLHHPARLKQYFVPVGLNDKHETRYNVSIRRANSPIPLAGSVTACTLLPANTHEHVCGEEEGSTNYSSWFHGTWSAILNCIFAPLFWDINAIFGFLSSAFTLSGHSTTLKGFFLRTEPWQSNIVQYMMSTN
jgi:hypothetical protein